MFFVSLFICIGVFFLVLGLVSLAIEEPIFGVINIFFGTIVGSMGLVLALVQS